MHTFRTWLLSALIVFFCRLNAIGGPPNISQDRDLVELDLNKWDCAQRQEGSAKTPDGAERNRLKNRIAGEFSTTKTKSFDSAEFLKYVGEFDAQTTGKRRKDLLPAERQKLEPLEKEVVQLTGYLGLAYPGPPESTNCGAVDYHDWHLEIVEKPPEHAPQVGDPTAIICEITPRTQNAIYRNNVRIQSMAGFFRRFDLEYESTGHRAQKIRLTGYLLWDDEHNGSADVGSTIARIGANKYHNPWRKSAWEIHPVIKIEPLEGGTTIPSKPNEPALSPSPSDSPEETPSPTPSPSISPTPTPVLAVTLLKPVAIKIPYGETVLPRGTKLKMIKRDGATALVEYMGHNYSVPITSTDLQ